MNNNSIMDLKVQFLNGGLANQVFQYMFARYYEFAHLGKIMYLDDSYFANNTVHNGYELNKVFGLRPHLLSECFSEEEWEEIIGERREGKSVPTIFNEKYGRMVMVTEIDNYKTFNPFDGEVMPIPANQFFPEIMEVPFNTYYHGYWINKNWFRSFEKEFRKELVFPAIPEGDTNSVYMEQIKNTNSVSLHVRRGDYVTIGIAMESATYAGLCQEYIRRYSKNWTVFVFSDDIEWCKANAEAMGLTLFENVVFVEGNVAGKNFRDMQLMSHCKGMIMSNSAFCYLAGLLRENNEYVLNLSKREL